MAASNEELVRKLTAMKTKVDDARVDKAKADGQVDAAMARLKEFGFDNLDAARQSLDEQRDRLAEHEDAVRRGVAELQDKYSL